MRNAAIDKHKRVAPDAPDAEETHDSGACGAEEGEEEEQKEEDAALEVWDHCDIVHQNSVSRDM